MGYREVGGQKTYYKFKECEKGQTLVEGVFRREFDGKFGKQYEYQNDDGRIVVLNAAGNLRYKMDFIKPDTKVKIVYDGEIKLDKGKMAGKMCHQFIVLTDDSYDLDEDVAENADRVNDEGLDEFDDL